MLLVLHLHASLHHGLLSFLVEELESVVQNKPDLLLLVYGVLPLAARLLICPSPGIGDHLPQMACYRRPASLYNIG